MAAFAPFYRAVRLGPVPLVAGLGATRGRRRGGDLVRDGRAAAGAHAVRPRDRARGHDLGAHLRARAGAARARGIRCKAGLLATLAASLFGLSLFAGARAIEQVPELWLPAGSRTLGHRADRDPAALASASCRAPGRFLRFVFYSALAQSSGYFAFLDRGRLERRLGARRARLAGLGRRHGDLVPRARRATLQPSARRHRRPPDRRRARRGDALTRADRHPPRDRSPPCTWGSISVLEARASRALGGPERAGLDLRGRARGDAARRADPRHPRCERQRVGLGDGRRGRLARRAGDDVHGAAVRARRPRHRHDLRRRARSRRSSRPSAGESLHPLSVAAIGVSAIGTFVLMSGDGGAEAPPRERRGILLALGAASLHGAVAVRAPRAAARASAPTGCSSASASRASGWCSCRWRSRGRLRSPRGVLVPVIVAGVGEVVGLQRLHRGVGPHRRRCARRDRVAVRVDRRDHGLARARRASGAAAAGRRRRDPRGRDGTDDPPGLEPTTFGRLPTEAGAASSGSSSPYSAGSASGSNPAARIVSSSRASTRSCTRSDAGRSPPAECAATSRPSGLESAPGRVSAATAS